MTELKGKVAIITGAGSGFGKEMAISFAQAGVNLVICGRTFEKIAKVEELITSQYDVEVLPIRADVSSEADVKMLIAATMARFEKIDILINNAAALQHFHIIDSPLDSWEYLIHNNATSVFLMIRESLPVMRKQKAGHIINITSGLVKEGAGGFGAYTASKAAIEALSYSVEDEEHRNGIQVHVFNPGVMKTGLITVGDNPASVAPYVVKLAQSDSSGERKVIEIDDFKIIAKEA